MLKRMSAFALVVVVVGSLSSCAELSKGISGAGLGAAGGALVGQAIGHNTESTLIGAAVGTMAGYIVGNEMDKADQSRLNSVYESGPSGQPVVWQNPDSGNSYTVTPQPVVSGKLGACRRAEIEAVIDGRREVTTAMACRDQYGQWELKK